ncbi:hypothetical protein [Brumimicrobium mesophilum]|uniref:hypothetical protein n=1 Tax=Brumimicrobium mesophilum TaxID=392717 RepID=UPI000D1444D5|nr:hypothetical protein [Brumimicrobium mesophilum]
MKHLFFLFSLLFILVSCGGSTKDQVQEVSYMEYFYPTDSLIPFIYVYQNTKEALDEKVHRIYRSETPEDTTLVVEYYNSDLKITEGYTHDLMNELRVIDHMIVDGDGKKRQAKLTENTFFPQKKGEQTQFLSDFPSHLDSLTMIYQSKRRVLEENSTVSVLGKQVPAIVIEDSVNIIFANPYTKETGGQNVMITRTFAKGYGMVKWSANNEQIVYKLERILSNKWWEEYAQAPQVAL